MNIFEKETGFIGDAPIEHLRKGLDEFWQQVLSIRKHLGNRVYLFDNYLELLFLSVNNTLAQDAAGDGFGKLSEYKSLIADIFEEKNEQQSHPLFEKAKACMEKFVVGYQEKSTQYGLFMVGIISDVLEYAAQKFTRSESDDFSSDIDFIKLKQLYEKICTLLGGEDEMEQLNFLFKQRFILVPFMLIFLQGFNNDLIYILTHRDDETHQLIFQLYLEDLEEREAE